MKKKLLCTILGLSLVMTIAIMPAYAVSVSVGNTSGEQDAAGNISISKQETEELLSEKLEEVADVLGNENMDMAMCPMSDGSLYAVKAYDIGDGCTLTVELRDQSELAVETPSIMPLATSGSNEMWKDYGSRYFTGKATVTVAGESVSMSLENHYILSANGIDENFGKPSINKTGNVTVTKGTPSVTTSTARSVGSSVSMYCNFTCKGMATTATYKMNTSVKYLAHNKTNKQVKVGHSWNLTKVS